MPFMVTCPQCSGRRRYYRPKATPMPPITNAPHDVGSVAIAYERELIKCPKCDGSGEIAQTERVPVMQDGRQIGTVPPSFDPQRIESTSPLYDPRAGDFVRAGDAWSAHPMLGDGDLEAVPGFVWKRTT